MTAFTETYQGGIFGKTIKKEGEAALEKFAKANGYMKTVSKEEAYREWQKLKTYNPHKLNGMSLNEYLAEHVGKEVIDRTVAEKEFCDFMKNKYSLISRSDISDMFEPIMTTTDFPFGVGHGRKYWNGRDNGKEGFAEMFSAKVNNPESWEVIKEYFPESVEIFEDMLKVVN